MSHIKVVRKDSVVDEVEQMQQHVARRAYELFERRGAVTGDSMADWFAAEREMVRRPAIELREEHGAYVVSASVAGIDPEEVHVEVTPQDVVISAETASIHVPRDARVHQSEFRAGRVFRSVHFPSAIDVAKAQAEYRNGVLTVKAPIAPAASGESRVA